MQIDSPTSPSSSRVVSQRVAARTSRGLREVEKFVEYSKLCDTQRRAPRTRIEMDVRRARETYEVETSFATDAGAGTAPDDLVRVVIVREDATVSAEPSSSARLVSRRESLASSATAMKCSFRDCSTMVIDQRGFAT